MSVNKSFRTALFTILVLSVVAVAAVSTYRRTLWPCTGAPPDDASHALHRNVMLPAVSHAGDMRRRQTATESPIRFAHVTERSGIDFEYYGSPSPQLYMTEQNGGGVALLDYNGDGRLDLFFVNGSHFERPAEKVGASNRLYRALGALEYEDVTESAGLAAFGFGMGCAAADYDNDGFTDLFVTYYGPNRLWHNNGDGTFEEVTVQAGLGDEQWGASAAFADLDGDGNLELYVTNYLECPQRPPLQSSCSPWTQPGQADRLYRNQGDGRFENAGSQAGIEISADGKGLAVEIVDLDQDQRLDIYVANDTTRNFLFRNLGGLHFEEEGVVQGVAVSEDGHAGSSMGIACGDYNGDGRFDLCVTNFRGQVNDVFSNEGEQGFLPTNSELRVNAVSRPALGFGIVLADFDLDGWPDLYVANGHIWDSTSLGEQYEYEMFPHLLRNKGGKRFVDVSQAAGDYFQKRWLGRATAFGDLDNDGDTDLVVSQLMKPPALLRNDSRRAGKSLQIKLIGIRSSRQPLGARVEAVVSGRTVATHVPAGGSFQASNDDRVLIATGDSQSVSSVRVWWPGGAVETWRNLPAGGTVRLVEGAGEAVR